MQITCYASGVQEGEIMKLGFMKNIVYGASLLLLLSVVALADALADEPYQKIGPDTGLPIPRYISLNSNEAFMRRGPSQDYPVEWIYHRAGYPVRVIGESGHWRKVQDAEGVVGWFHYALLSGVRTGVVTDEKVELRKDAAENSQISAILQKGVIGQLQACTASWCQLEIDGIAGWLPKSSFWGAGVEEVFEKE